VICSIKNPIYNMYFHDVSDQQNWIRRHASKFQIIVCFFTDSSPLTSFFVYHEAARAERCWAQALTTVHRKYGKHANIDTTKIWFGSASITLWPGVNKWCQRSWSREHMRDREWNRAGPGSCPCTPTNLSARRRCALYLNQEPVCQYVLNTFNN